MKVFSKFNQSISGPECAPRVPLAIALALVIRAMSWNSASRPRSVSVSRFRNVSAVALAGSRGPGRSLENCPLGLRAGASWSSRKDPDTFEDRDELSR